MKEIDVEKVRAAILSLQSNGKTEYASVVWDLLDNYVSQKPKPIVMRQDGINAAHDHVKAAKAIVKSLRGASAFSGLPFCRAHEYDSVNVGDCNEYAIGTLNTEKFSYPMCRSHGEGYDDSAHGADWVQTFFGDENSAMDVAEYQSRMTIKATDPAPDLQCEIGGHFFGAEFAGKCSRPAVGYIHLNGADVQGCESCGTRHGTLKHPFVHYA
jgi:hypothetical protein